MSMNLKSNMQIMAPLSTWKLVGHPHRSYLAIDVHGENKFDIAVVPAGEAPGEDYWLDGIGSSRQLLIPHTGDIYFRDTDNPGDETVRTISNIKCVFVEVL
jgi:hypothetical protein